MKRNGKCSDCHKMGPPDGSIVGRIHPTKGYQWWECGAYRWRAGVPWPSDAVLAWEDTWCEPEAED